MGLIIEMMDVSKYYEGEVPALKGISVQVDAGEFVYIVGPSGSGKSTFTKLIYREEKVSKGYIKVGDFDLVRLKNRDIPYLRRFVGVIYQDFKLLPKLTVYENVAYAMEVVGKRPKEIKQRVNEVLELVHLSAKKDRFPDELSGGEQQRVAIARAIANMPKVLIADEPTGNLDPETSVEIMQILEKINKQGTTILMATHNSQIVNHMRHRVIAIENGKIVRDQNRGGYAYVR
ncbi:cell division ATP-binding protein FtsE [Atopobacter sp. AH10]|uniref:cell division ATP-binding protein FtsE n=1 Tax=Atopobacter sp. AH10 TaxID=2315861 RepID=UPI000EF18441|nr:cell division ATP-binding protein FtsE [Atopobacter sp. AH10]RLK62562.1 cell division ATP-binding protein FtsE [Atopobacter sp. AH10]